MINIKACNKIKDFLLSFFIMCLILFNIFIVSVCFSGCGLDTFYSIDAPKADTMPIVDDNGIDKQTFVFFTQDTGSTDSFTFLGTDVYYKIYSDKSDWESEKNSLAKLASDDVPNSADKLLFPDGGGGYGYQKLETTGSGDGALVQHSNSSQRVEIRLTDSPVEEFRAIVKINGSSYGAPIRFGNSKSFNFGAAGGKNMPNPKSGAEKDVKYRSSPDSDDKWYVALFAFSSGRDAAYTKYYSNITYLGSVTIDSSREYN